MYSDQQTNKTRCTLTPPTSLLISRRKKLINKYYRKPRAFSMANGTGFVTSFLSRWFLEINKSRFGM